MTARRREESLQDVPVAITALSTADLENKMLRQVDDLKNFVPGLHVQGLKRDDSTIYIRGQGPGSQVTGQRNFSSIATYFAEVPTTIAGPGVFFDLTNVQVLKGPQGTLFGRNTTGGAVLFEPAAPTWDNEGYAQVQFGNYSMKQFNGVLNVAPVRTRWLSVHRARVPDFRLWRTAHVRPVDQVPLLTRYAVPSPPAGPHKIAHGCPEWNKSLLPRAMTGRRLKR